MESKYLGTIDLDGGVGGGAMDASITYNGSALQVRLEIDYPGRLENTDHFGETTIDDVDNVLGNLDFIDGLARTTIATGIARIGTAAEQMFTAWMRNNDRDADEKHAFLHGLRPTKLTITPDGGKINRDRVVMSYGLVDRSVNGTVTVRFVEPTGPELAPAPRGGYS